MSSLSVVLVVLAVVTGAFASFAIFRGLRALRRRLTADTDFAPKARAKVAPPSRVFDRLDKNSWSESESFRDAALLGADETAKQETKDIEREVKVDSDSEPASLTTPIRASEPMDGSVPVSSESKADADVPVGITEAKQEAKPKDMAGLDQPEVNSLDKQSERCHWDRQEFITSSNFPESIDPSSDHPVDWCEDYVEIEAGLGVVCAKSNSYVDSGFKSAQDVLRHEHGLFLIHKGKSVQSKECSFVLAARLSDLSDNVKIQDAYAIGIPVVLAKDVLKCEYGNPVKSFLARGRLEEYQDLRRKFEANWELVSLVLDSEIKYFLTHSSAGGQLKVIEAAEEYLGRMIGPAIELKGSGVPKKKEVDMVVVPTLKTTSKKYDDVLGRTEPPLVVKVSDLKGVQLGDQVPAWRWRGGAYFQYPPIERPF